jgi:ABC-type nitrate/sulfonate/bicarbonate transport system permease component
MRKHLLPVLVGALSLAIVLAIWEVAGRTGHLNPILMPTPTAIATTLAGLVVEGRIFAPLGHTLLLFAAGYGIACVLGILVGAVMGVNNALYNLLEPLIELVRPLPKSALTPVLYLFIGAGPALMITIVALGAFFPIVINTLGGVRGIDPTLLDTARTFRCSRTRTIFGVVLPAIAPMILAGMRVALGLGLVLIILAEMLVGEDGLGFMIIDLQRSFQIREMYAWVVVLAVLGGVITVLFDTLDRRLVPWRGRS